MTKLLLSRSYSANGSIIPKSIIETQDGNYLMVGRYFDKTPDSSAFATMLLPNGNVIWNKVFDYPFTQFFSSVTQLKDGSYVAVGSYFYSEYSGDEYIWIVQFNNEGNVLWQTAIGTVGVQSDACCVTATFDGGYIVSAVVIEKGVPLTRVLKFSEFNKLQWSEFYNVGIGYSIVQTKDGGYLLSGAVTKKDSLLCNVFILRLNYKGEVVLKKVYEDYDIYELLHSSAIETRRGNFAIVAKSLIMKVDSYGNVIWAKQDYENNFSSIAQKRDDNYVVTGSKIINDIDHAYITVVNNEIGVSLKDNTELLYPSEFTDVVINSEDDYVSCGYAPFKVNDIQAVLAIFS